MRLHLEKRQIYVPLLERGVYALLDRGFKWWQTYVTPQAQKRVTNIFANPLTNPKGLKDKNLYAKGVFFLGLGYGTSRYSRMAAELAVTIFGDAQFPSEGTMDGAVFKYEGSEYLLRILDGTSSVDGGIQNVRVCVWGYPVPRMDTLTEMLSKKKTWPAAMEQLPKLKMQEISEKISAHVQAVKRQREVNEAYVASLMEESAAVSNRASDSVEAMI